MARDKPRKITVRGQRFLAIPLKKKRRTKKKTRRGRGRTARGRFK